MCGIAGIVHFTEQSPDSETLRRMTQVIHHRGPDDEGFFTDKRAGLGFRRLSIIDLREGRQPLSNEDESVWIVFNGEIYNYKSLRGELEAKGHRFRTNSDTEVIVHLYEEYGEDCVHRLRGMFGFAIWDQNRNLLFAARDPFGIKPFYYARDHSRFLFASEIKSILAAGGFDRGLDIPSLLNYLTFQYVPEPHTMFEGISKLPPAHFMKVGADGKISIERYWDPIFEPEERPLEETVEAIREKLKDSVRHHMQSDVKRGCFLSSGIDSTAIAAYMRDMEPIQTFSVGFEGPQNETEIAYETAKALGTEHYAKVIGRDEFFDSLPKAVWHQDEPLADPSAIALYHLAKLAREHVTVVLSGEGADELFGGYRIYREPLALRPFSWLPRPVQIMLNRLIRRIPLSFKGKNYLLRATTPLEERFLGNARIFGEELKEKLVRVDPELLATYINPVQVARPFYERTKHLDPISRMQYIDLNLWLPGDILMKADKMTMAHSLELRVPFLDRDVFDLARKIPPSQRLAKSTTKYVFRKAMEGIVPEFILNRPKLGFPVPLRGWLKDPRLADRMFEQMETRSMGDLFNLDVVRTLFREHQQGVEDHCRKIWVLYIFSLWYEAYMSERPAVSRNPLAG